MKEDFKASLDFEGFSLQLRDLLERLPDGPIDSPPLGSKRLKELRAEIEKVVSRLKALSSEIDPVRMPQLVFDPSEPSVIGRLIALTLLEQPRHALAGVEPFYGSGVYALYHKGPFEAYTPITGSDHPIYVGKADPATHDASSAMEQGDRLSRRLAEHAKSIRSAGSTLAIEDFDCRFLVVKSAWQKTAEDYLIGRFKPVWNSETKVCYGFGKHGDSPSTRSNTRSPWDTLHPGREWATRSGNVPNAKSIQRILLEIKAHFEKNPPLSSATRP